MDRHTYIDGRSLKPQGLSIIERISISILYSWTDGECYLGKNEWGMNFVQPWFKASLHIGPGFDWAMSLHMARIPMSCVRTALKQGIWWLATRQCCICFGPFFFPGFVQMHSFHENKYKQYLCKAKHLCCAFQTSKPPQHPTLSIS